MRSPQQPGQRPARQGTARRGHRRLSPGSAPQARLCRSPQQPGQLPCAIRDCRRSHRRLPPSSATQARLCRWHTAIWAMPCATRGCSTKASAAYREALRLKPDDAEAHSNLGNVLRDQGLLDEADRRLPPSRRAETGFRSVPQQSCSHSALSRAIRSERSAGRKPSMGTPARRSAEAVHPAARQRSLARSTAEDRLRLARLSQPSGRPIIFCPCWPRTIPAQVEIFCYSDVIRPDAITQRIRGYAHQWRNVVGMNDQQVAEQIHQDRIDILIDLAAHTASNRLLVFARKPAPIQATYLAIRHHRTGHDRLSHHRSVSRSARCAR